MARMMVKTSGTATEDLAVWFLSGDTLSARSLKSVAGMIKQIRVNRQMAKSNDPVTQEELGRWIAQARQYLELHKGHTLWNIRGVGYRVATKDELAVYTARSVRRTIVMADRTTRLLDIVDRNRMPAALRSVFVDEEGKIRHVGKTGRKYLTLFAQYVKGERKMLGKEDANVTVKS